MMLSEGLLNKQIAYELGVSEATIKAHVSAILQKLGVESRTQAVIAAAKIAGGQWRQGTPSAGYRRTPMSRGSEKALLFDIDSTLADTDALHLEAFNQVFGPRGNVFDHACFTRELAGFSNASIGARFLAEEPPTRRAAIIGEK